MASQTGASVSLSNPPPALAFLHRPAHVGESTVGSLAKPDMATPAARRLVDALHELHHHAGRPSLRDLGRQVGVSRTTVGAAFSEPRVPRWGLLELIVEALGGDVDEFH